MEFKIYKSFAKDLKKVRDKKRLDKVKEVVEDIKESVQYIENEDEIAFKIKNTKKIIGSKSAYRIKVNDSYRIGAEVETESDEEVVEKKKFFLLKRFLHRKYIYNKFP